MFVRVMQFNGQEAMLNTESIEAIYPCGNDNRYPSARTTIMLRGGHVYNLRTPYESVGDALDGHYTVVDCLERGKVR